MRLRPNHSRLLLSPLFALQEKTPNQTNHAPTKVHKQGNHKSRGTNGAPEIPPPSKSASFETLGAPCTHSAREYLSTVGMMESNLA